MALRRIPSTLVRRLPRRAPRARVMMLQWTMPARCPRLRAVQAHPQEAQEPTVAQGPALEARPRALGALARRRMGPPAAPRAIWQAPASRPPTRRRQPRRLDSRRAPVAPSRQRRDMRDLLASVHSPSLSPGAGNDEHGSKPRERVGPPRLTNLLFRPWYGARARAGRRAHRQERSRSRRPSAARGSSTQWTYPSASAQASAGARFP